MSRQNISEVGKRFTSEYQPSNEAKRAGHKYKYSLRKGVAKYLTMDVIEFAKIQEDVKNHPEKYKMWDLACIAYVANIPKNVKYTIDHRDRAEGKATVHISHEGNMSVDHFFNVLDEIDKEENDDSRK